MRDRSHTTTPYEGLRLLAIHAHPDDEASKGAATSAKYAALGARVMVVTMTGGEAGDILNPALEGSPAAIRDIAGLRREEMAKAARTLGVEHVWAGYVDSGLPDGDPDELTPRGSFYRVPIEVSARTLVSVIRRFRPHVVTTYDERGGYPHPDHIRTHDVSMVALEHAAQSGSNPELGDPWRVQKVYFNQDLSARKFLEIHRLIEAEGGESPFAGTAGVVRQARRGAAHVVTERACAAGSSSPCGIRPSSPMRPRSTRTADSSPAAVQRLGSTGSPRSSSSPTTAPDVPRWTARRTSSSPTSSPG